MHSLCGDVSEATRCVDIPVESCEGTDPPLAEVVRELPLAAGYDALQGAAELEATVRDLTDKVRESLSFSLSLSLLHTHALALVRLLLAHARSPWTRSGTSRCTGSARTDSSSSHTRRTYSSSGCWTRRSPMTGPLRRCVSVGGGTVPTGTAPRQRLPFQHTHTHAHICPHVMLYI